MTEKEALERAVILSPLDDLPRLVMADWLDENGEGEFAEFIRVQIELARTECSPLCNLRAAGVRSNGCVCERGGLRRREFVLFKHPSIGKFFPEEMDMSISLTDKSANGHPTAQLIRGFPSRVILPSLAAWERHGREIVSRAPVVEIVVSDREPERRAGSDYDGWCSFRWYESSYEIRAEWVDTLPAPVFRRIVDMGLEEQHPNVRHWFWDRDSALTAAARAFADEARARAGLEPVWCGALAGGER